MLITVVMNTSPHPLAPLPAAETAQRIAGALEAFEAAAFKAFARLPILLQLLLRLCKSLRDAMELRTSAAGEPNDPVSADFAKATSNTAAPVKPAPRARGAGGTRTGSTPSGPIPTGTSARWDRTTKSPGCFDSFGTIRMSRSTSGRSRTAAIPPASNRHTPKHRTANNRNLRRPNALRGALQTSIRSNGQMTVGLTHVVFITIWQR